MPLNVPAKQLENSDFWEIKHKYMYVILGSFISNKARKIAILTYYICYAILMIHICNNIMHRLSQTAPAKPASVPAR